VRLVRSASVRSRRSASRGSTRADSHRSPAPRAATRADYCPRLDALASGARSGIVPTSSNMGTSRRAVPSPPRRTSAACLSSTRLLKKSRARSGGAFRCNRFASMISPKPSDGPHERRDFAPIEFRPTETTFSAVSHTESTLRRDALALPRANWEGAGQAVRRRSAAPPPPVPVPIAVCDRQRGPGRGRGGARPERDLDQPAGTPVAAQRRPRATGTRRRPLGRDATRAVATPRMLPPSHAPEGSFTGTSSPRTSFSPHVTTPSRSPISAWPICRPE
jgi:hypothetical protein